MKIMFMCFLVYWFFLALKKEYSKNMSSGKEFHFKSGSKLLRTFFWCLYRKGVAIHAYLNFRPRITGQKFYGHEDFSDIVTGESDGRMNLVMISVAMVCCLRQRTELRQAEASINWV